MNLSIVIPCYNEERNIRAGALEKVTDYLKYQSFSWEVLIVDDGSTDQSSLIVQKFIQKHPGFSLIKNPHQGKAATVITGMLKAKGDYILFCDLDQATPITELEKFLPWTQKEVDVIIGSRKTVRQGAPFSRILMARGFIFLRTMILGLGSITDTQCGFKVFKKEAAAALFNKLRLFKEMRKVDGSMVTAGFDTEILYLAKKLKFQIKEIPVNWHYVETRRVNPLKDSWYGFWDLVKISINNLRGLYD